MKVKMLVHGSGPDGAVKPGSEIEVSDDHGKELVAGGYAEEVPEPEPEEPAGDETPETETDEPAADETPETEAEEPAADETPETEAEEPAADEPPETETKKAPRKRRRTAKSGS